MIFEHAERQHHRPALVDRPPDLVRQHRFIAHGRPPWPFRLGAANRLILLVCRGVFKAASERPRGGAKPYFPQRAALNTHQAILATRLFTQSKQFFNCFFYFEMQLSGDNPGAPRIMDTSLLVRLRPTMTVLAIAAAFAALLGGTYLIERTTVDSLLYHDIESTSRDWANHLARNLPDLEQIAAGQPPARESREFFQRTQQVGQVFRYKQFSPAGELRLVSDELGLKPPTAAPPDEHNLRAVRAIQMGEALVEVKEGTPPHRPRRYGEAYVPVVRDGRLIAIAEVYVDRTEKYAVFGSHFRAATLALAALMTIAFAVPSAAFYRRSREKQAVDDQVRFLAHHDPLTQLANRASFQRKLAEALARAGKSRGIVAVHYLDLDRFKEINDTLGHAAGDELLIAFAERLRSVVRPADIVGRLGGDEFAIAQTGISDSAAAARIAGQLMQSLSVPFTVAEQEIAVTSSIGIALSPTDGADPSRLFKSADLALYAAKARGRSRYAFFEAAMDAEVEARKALERTIREAAITEGFELHFQPLCNNEDRRISGFEALLRLRRADGTYIPPSVLIPVAEEMGLIDTIGAWVIRRACAAAAAWPDPLTVAVNLSPVQFKDGQLTAVVREALTKSGLPARRQELEITKGLLLSNTAPVLEQLGALKSLGVSIVMDDFGTGYSSLSYLWKFPFDRIKIDQSFMRAFADNKDVTSVLRTIVALGRSMNMQITAEGVETEEQANFLYEIECDQLQGFHLGRPMPEAEIAAALLRDFEGSIAPDHPEQPGRADVSAA
ncbi:MAG: putative bifunctional diguanylate cyclase/phosphodiesterase [Hyphomicrobiales bacterium]